MIETWHLISLSDEYLRATGVKDVTLSFWVFNDSKKLAALRSGAEITVGRYNAAVTWFDQNWPADGVWPGHVSRPLTAANFDEFLANPSPEAAE